MTPTKLLDALKKDIKKISDKSAIFREEIQVFKGDIPLSQDEEEEDDKYFPCVVIRPDEGEIKSVNDNQQVKCDVYICAYDTSTDMQGYTATMLLAEFIIQEISLRGNVGNQFRLEYPIKWKMHENLYPYYICEVKLIFQTYTVKGNINDFI